MRDHDPDNFLRRSEFALVPMLQAGMCGVNRPRNVTSL